MPDPLDLRIASPEDAIASHDGRLVDLIDGLLDCGVALRGELWLSVADIDLVFLGLDLVIADPGKMRRPDRQPVRVS